MIQPHGSAAALEGARRAIRECCHRAAIHGHETCIAVSGPEGIAMNYKPWRILVSIAFLMVAGAALGLRAPSLAGAQPKAIAPYAVSVFATSPPNTAQPDSIVAWGDSIIVGFQNHVAKDGSDGKSSTIVEFSLSGEVKRTFSVVGHNDGLRVVGEGKLWALQNEDANPN